jgi:hypothetical protein
MIIIYSMFIMSIVSTEENKKKPVDRGCGGTSKGIWKRGAETHGEGWAES